MRRIFGWSSWTSRTPQKKTITDPVVDHNTDTRRPVYGNIKDKGLKKIHRAALIGDVSEVQALLQLHKRALNELDSQHRTPLHLAAAHGHSAVVTLLVERKCDLNLRDAEHRTALVKAVQSQKEECVRILLEHGADPDILDIRGNSALHYAAGNENESIITKLLLHKANIEARNQNGCTPLLYAAREKNQKIIEFLLNKGADINAVDRFGSSALAHAACYDSADTVHVLLRHGIDCSSEDVFGRTADQFAHHRGFIKNQKIILAYKSKKDKENKKNEKNRKEEKKKNDKKKEENDLAKMNAHKDTEKRRPMKLNFEDSCATLSESIDFETKVKEGKKHKSSDMKLEDVSDSTSVSSGLNQQAKSGKTDNQHCSIVMTKDPYRVQDKQKNKSQSDTCSSSESESESESQSSMKVDGKRLKPDENVTRVQDKQKNKSQSDTCSSSESESESESQSSMKVDGKRLKLKPDENVTSNIPGLHKSGVRKSKNETCNSAVSVPKVSRKTGALHSVTGDSRRHESRQNNGSNVYNFFLYRVPGLTRKKGKKSTYEMNMPTEALTVTHETAGVVFPEQGDSRRHENNQYVGRPVKKTSNEKKEINPTDDSDDITQTSETASMGCDSFYSEHENCTLLMEQLCMNCKDFINFSKCQDLICPHKRLCEIKDNHCELLKKKYRKMKDENCALKTELLATKDISSQLKQQNLKQEYCCCNLRDRLQREEEHYRSGAQVKQQLESTLSAVVMELRALRSDLMKASESNEREKDPVHKSHTLQDEISMLKLEINTMKNKNQEKEKTIEILEEMNDFLRETIQLSEERLTKTVSQHCEQLLVLKCENNLLSTQLENEKLKTETLKSEVESCHRRQDAAVQDRGQSHKSERDLECHFQGQERRSYI
ncbi:ankyrin repeat domain-containing protein 26-like [Talpa occidentalis]|uniref:ankyrin repeat domain-containing protein 26-like n=1 Tax=Talpa occidentalis TaxID=50954 RepID=UPI0023F907D1|nr:ankyrin repeat domain-containing protein 26-like [Talpa occidentalis]